MAEQDFNIKVRTTADTSGIKQTEAALKDLEAKGISGTVAQQLAAASVTFDPKTGLFKSVETSAATATAAIKNTTTALSGMEAVGNRVGRSLTHMIGAFLGIGTVLEFVNQMKQTADQIEKITDELSKQGDQLVKNAQLFSEQAKFATSEADVLKIGTAALREVEITHKRITDLQKVELNYWQQFLDSLGKGGFIGIGPIQQALDAARKTAAEQAQTAQDTAYLDVLAARTTMARNATQTYEETVKELNDRIKEQQALAETHFANKDIQSYLSAASAVEKYKKELEDLKAVHDRLTEKTEKYVEGADPQVKAILANEKAMFEARATGRTGDAAMFEKSALALRRGATPEQLADVAKVYSSPVVVEALKQIGANTRALVDLWK